MTITLLKPEDYVTSEWSGGTTTQLAIAPKGAVYAERDFLWRISSAAVDLDESDFTPLIDYHRIISTLRGDMVLAHNGGAPLTLKAYEVHEFEGGDDTHSWGRCRDFNLMLRKGKADGRVCAVHAEEECQAYRVPRQKNSTLLLYCASGGARIDCAAESYAVKEGESLLMEECSGQEIIITAQNAATLMAAEAWCR